MIPIKSASDIKAMRQACRVAGLSLQEAGRAVAPGVTTASLDAIVRRLLAEHGASPSFLGYLGYPAAACISINEQVIHGIPGRRRLREGDIVSIDVGAYIDGFHGDTAATFAVGEVSSEASRLIDVTRECFYQGVAAARMGQRVSDISRAVQRHAQQNGFSVVRDFTGHGVGASLHEDPQVPNFWDDTDGRGARLLPGMTLAIEPMINAGTHSVNILRDRWTVVTADGSLSAHYEHTVLITSGAPELLTLGE